ncbi:hypothetical protein AAT19DRAFT_10150 [Rhodotorula toruloides]|uniref:Uncharacterized protein n=1 Tax=Rhodotorula toruloides TaxID=5286 RepID=A0A2S9ZZW3_RHOTO|nr:hypothetical protein AAT19DRAFT_10150 [Rhodotorula toruloides]
MSENTSDALGDCANSSLGSSCDGMSRCFCCTGNGGCRGVLCASHGCCCRAESADNVCRRLLCQLPSTRVDRKHARDVTSLTTLMNAEVKSGATDEQSVGLDVLNPSRVSTVSTHA